WSRFQTLEQELFRLPPSAMATSSRHRLVCGDFNVLWVPDDVRRNDIDIELCIMAYGLDAHAVAQCFGITSEVVLGLDEELAVLVLGVINHGVDVPGGSNVGDAVANPEQG